jgi:hypothetical protein
LGNKSNQDKRRSRRKRQKINSTLIWIGVGIIVVIVIGLVLWNILRPSAGDSVPIMANAGEHVPDGDNPGPFITDPPTSGRHYASEYEAGFYEPSDPQVNVAYPEGYLIHNLEHGYVVFWYNCEILNEDECSTLKGRILEVMAEFDNFKLIGFPWSATDAPLVMTSWGQLQEFQAFDAERARNFIRSNRNRAPEPNAP